MSGSTQLEAVRLDRWLVAVRIFKSRSQAAKAIAGGRIKMDGQSVKAHRMVHLDDEIVIKADGRTYKYVVTGLIEKRVGAPLAREQYKVFEDPDLKPEMRELVRVFRDMEKKSPKNKGRPTKRDRRMIEKIRDL